MIARLAGTLIHKLPPLMVIDVAGVGYEVEAPLSVFYDLPEVGQAVVVLTHLSIKDDSHTLYGFSSEAQRTVFRQLLKISGIGAKLALTILSGATSEELARYVAEEDSAALTRLPGIGKKTAERIIIELRDKLDIIPVSAGGAPENRTSAPASAVGEAITALNALGYKPQESSSMARAVAEPDMDVEEIIRLALKSVVRTL
ncbi:MAG: Holliday junction branch migration protein RuvA [Xanthomonadales bacterium]|nr:Holliday junction branch migration protein RuvA [Gammaproteobacteria bacterium]MBT8053680.1 Holliday junction branch migration protein RuvA [Gammaproteobacteria bacterium]NND57065.1 Holliday junction branch migration protein RuvA [Xanthomonadales bacterium]NNK51853.1 Holliday junction branch migration protein RuvA [Xanthomonadales bacterium]